MKEHNERSQLEEHLICLKLPFFTDHYQEFASQAARKNWTYVDYLDNLVSGEAALRRDRSVGRRIRKARFPLIKTLDQFNWSWPKKINRLQVQNLFRLAFLKDKSNIIFLGGVGLGKTHLASALGYAACLKNYTVLFATAIDLINTLSAAQRQNRLKEELKKYTRPALLIVDELGYVEVEPVQVGLFFTLMQRRHKQKSTLITSNLGFEQWTSFLKNDQLTAALMDRLTETSHVINMRNCVSLRPRLSQE